MKRSGTFYTGIYLTNIIFKQLSKGLVPLKSNNNFNLVSFEVNETIHMI